MPQVSVVIAAYNAERWLGQTLDSVLAGSFEDIEIIVVDDGSRDATAAVARARGARVRVLSQANAGMSAARNAGMAAASAPLVALLDADDLWHPQKLALQVQVMQAGPDWGLCYSEFFSWDGLQPPVWAPDPTAALDERLSGFVYHRMLLTNYVLPSSVLFRRALLDQMGPFLCEDHQTDDWEYTVRASRVWKFAKLAAPLVAYRQTPGSLSRVTRRENVTETMRDRLIQRFGLRSPQGTEVDAQELAWRRYKGWRDHASTHVVRGSLAVGLGTFARLLARGPRRVDAGVTLGKSLVRRVIRP